MGFPITPPHLFTVSTRKSMDLIIGAPIEDKSPVIGNNAPSRKSSLTPPLELDVGVVVVVVLVSVTEVLG
jgi:hypothetical protein